MLKSLHKPSIRSVSLSKSDVLLIHSSSDFDLAETVIQLDTSIRLAITDLEAVALRSALCFLGFEIARRVNHSFVDSKYITPEVEDILFYHLSASSYLMSDPVEIS